MKVILDIRDDKAGFILELLNNFSFVKSTAITPYKAEVLEGLYEAVKEVKEIKAGKKKAKSLNRFLDEL